MSGEGSTKVYELRVVDQRDTTYNIHITRLSSSCVIWIGSDSTAPSLDALSVAVNGESSRLLGDQAQTLAEKLAKHLQAVFKNQQVYPLLLHSIRLRTISIEGVCGDRRHFE